MNQTVLSWEFPVLNVCILCSKPFDLAKVDVSRWQQLTGVGEVDVVGQVLGPEGALVDARTTPDRPARPRLADEARVELEVLPAGRTVYRPPACVSTSS